MRTIRVAPFQRNIKRISFVALCLAAPARLHAQELSFFNEIFKSATSATLFLQFADIRNSPQLGTKSSQCLLHAVCGVGTEILFSVTPKDAGVGVELGLGASYLRGFSGRPLPDTFDLRASIRSFPVLGAYVAWNKWDHFAPYVGGNFGFSDFWNAQVYNSKQQQLSVSAQTFNYGLLAGFSFDLGAIGAPFIEGGYHARRFASVRYGADKDTIPRSWPREIDMTGWQVEIGWQFDLKPEDQKAPPGFEGTWVLVAVDGAPLPGALNQVGEGSRLARHDIYAARLDLKEDSTYAVTWQEKAISLDREGHIQTIVPKRMTNRGRYSMMRDGSLKFYSDEQSPPLGLEAFRLGDEIILTHVEKNNSLTFKKVG